MTYGQNAPSCDPLSTIDCYFHTCICTILQEGRKPIDEAGKLRWVSDVNDTDVIRTKEILQVAMDRKPESESSTSETESET